MDYEKINWKNKPNKQTPINATNLNHMDDGIYEAHERIDANSIISTATGETILVTDSAKVPPENIKLFGKTTQVNTEGNQLLKNPENFSGVVVGDGVGLFSDVLMTVAGIYTFTFKLKNSTGNGWYMSFLDGDGNTIKSKNSFGTSVNIEFTQEEAEQIVKVMIWCNNAFNGYIGDYAMFNYGAEALPFEPYTGRQPSPSTDYPQELNSCGDDGSIEQTLLGGNLFKPNVNTVNCTYNNNGTYNIDNGKGVFCINADQSSIPMQEINIQNGNVTLSFTITAQTAYALESVFLCTMGSSTKNYSFVVNKTIAWNTLKMTHNFTFENNVEKIGLVFYGNTTNNLQIKDISLVVGTEDKGYEPYTEQTLTALTPNGLKGIPLGQTIPDSIKNSPIHMNGVYHDGEQYWIGNTKEYKDGKNVQRIEKCVLTSDSSIANLSAYTNQLNKVANFRCGAFNFFGLRNTPVMCEKLMSKSIWNLDEEGCWHVEANGIDFSISYDVLGITSNATSEERLTAIRTWLNTNELNFYHILNEPIITDLTEEELAQYNALYMNYPNTTITNDARAYMEVEYVASPKEYIANLEKKHDNDIQQLKTAIIALGGTI